MLAYLVAEGRGRIDELLSEFADDLHAQGVRVAGAVQVNGPSFDDQPCDMELRILTGAHVIRISQNLGAGSSGCRLDPTALEEAVGMVESAFTDADLPDLMIVNKFGKQEAEGRGFRPAIARAMEAGVPVLVGLREGQLDSFTRFAGDLAEPVSEGDMRDWVQGQLAAR